MRIKFEQDLRAAFERTVGPENVGKAIALIRSETQATDDETRTLALQSKAAQRRDSQSYHPHDTHTLVIEALNEYLDTCGAEYIGEVDMRDGPPVEYLNTGDSYAATLVWYRDGYRGHSYHVQSWSEAIEICERRGETMKVSEAIKRHGCCEISSGTLQPADLVPAYLSALKEIAPVAYQRVVSSGCGFSASYEWWQSDAAYGLLETLSDALSEHAPDGYYFGAHEGDSACFGFWPCDDSVLEDGV